MLKNDAPDFRVGRGLPDYRTPAEVILAALPALTPPSRITVSEVATRRKVKVGLNKWQDWDNSVAPYMVEPMNMVTSRLYDSLVFVGPARSSKSEALIYNPLAHSILASPRMTAIFHMTQGAVKELSVQELGPMIRNSPELAERLLKDNDHEKTFVGGARLTMDWPVSAKLSGRSVPLVLLSDYDHEQYQDVEGEGPAFEMARSRNTSAMSLGFTVAETSPRFPILDESWSPKTVHEAPPCEGALGLYNTGTRARLYWHCRDCGSPFQITFDRLEWPKDGTPRERAKKTYCGCLHCGSVIEHRHKQEFNRTAQWLHESPSGEAIPLEDGPRETPTLSYWLHGPAAALASWERIVTRYLSALEVLEKTGNENSLRGVTNLDLGLPYRPRGMTNSAKITESALRDGATDHAWQVTPAGTAFILISVDVQPGRFVVGVHAHLANGAVVLIDRWDIFQPPPDAPGAGGRVIAPARYIEDWAVLDELFDLTYPVANADYSLRAMCVICDSVGEPGVTPRAYDYYRTQKVRNPKRFHLHHGDGKESAPRAIARALQTAHQGRKQAAKDIVRVKSGTNHLKDEIAAALARDDIGPGSFVIPKGAPPEVFAEFAAERRTEKGWEKRPGVQRNEALDLAVMDKALAIILGVEKIKPGREPAWALADHRNAFAVTDGDRELEAEVETRKPKARRRKRRGRTRLDGWS